MLQTNLLFFQRFDRNNDQSQG